MPAGLALGAELGVRPRAPRRIAALEHVGGPVAHPTRDVAPRADDDLNDAADVRGTRFDHDLQRVLARLDSVEVRAHVVDFVAHVGYAAAASSFGCASSSSETPRARRGGNASLTILRTTLP